MYITGLIRTPLRPDVPSNIATNIRKSCWYPQINSLYDTEEQYFAWWRKMNFAFHNLPTCPVENYTVLNLKKFWFPLYYALFLWSLCLSTCWSSSPFLISGKLVCHGDCSIGTHKFGLSMHAAKFFSNVHYQFFIRLWSTFKASLLHFIWSNCMTDIFFLLRQLHTSTNLILLSLAVSDFSVGFLILFQLMLIDGCWYLNDSMCVLYYILDVVVTSASVGNMVLISIDRYVAICDPLHYSLKVTPKRVCVCISLCWICSLS